MLPRCLMPSARNEVKADTLWRFSFYACCGMMPDMSLELDADSKRYACQYPLLPGRVDRSMPAPRTRDHPTAPAPEYHVDRKRHCMHSSPVQDTRGMKRHICGDAVDDLLRMADLRWPDKRGREEKSCNP